MRVVFSRRAERSLEEIGDRIAGDDPRRALTFVEELRVKAAELSSFPQAFPIVPGFEGEGVRRRGYRPYLIF